jgi:hypothetical protein
MKEAVVTLLILNGLLMSGCSSVVNTVNGLSTYQSTISGSNYPFSVAPDSGKLQTNYQTIEAKKIIGKHESFEITLDSMFLRYLQASDPYVMIYSEAWMGSEAMPLDKTKLQRQIVLVKDGLSFNAMQPITSVPLLGPVTMGNDALDVHITMYVVVLSKSDNQQTIDYLNGAAAVASAAAPQYAVIAGAAAEVGKAIVNQNRDKIEFEHTFNFSPITTVDGIFKARYNTGPNLEEGKLVVIKGENEHRLLPYPNWHYYISPFNWYGHPPALNSIRFEAANGELKNVLPNLDEEGNYTLVNLPFVLLEFFLIPDNSVLSKCCGNPPLPPEELHVSGNFLLSSATPDPINNNVIGGGKTSFIDDLYHDKTYAILSVRRTDGTYGDFPQLYKSFKDAGYGSKIDELTTSRDEYLAKSSEAISSAANSVQAAIKFERARKLVYKATSSTQSNYKTIDVLIKNADITNENDINKLQEAYWDELSVQSAKRLKSGVDTLIKNAPNVSLFCSGFSRLIATEQNYWRNPGFKQLTQSDAQTQGEQSKGQNNLENLLNTRNVGWSSILLGLQNYLNERVETIQFGSAVASYISSGSLNINDDTIPNSTSLSCIAPVETAGGL